MKIIIEQDEIDNYPEGVAKVLSAIGHNEALVTDQSQVYDFLICIDIDGRDEEIEKHNYQIMSELRELLNREVSRHEYIKDLAKEWETKNQNNAKIKLH